MKKSLVIMAALALFTAPFSAFADGASGCGLGSMLFEGKKGLVPHVLGATTNGTSGNQTFGMTSGTSRCDVNTTVELYKQQEVFVAQNHESLMENMSQGQGEYLMAYAKVLGCDESVSQQFAETTQANFESIYNNTATAGDVLSNTKQTLKSSPLSQSCSNM